MTVLLIRMSKMVQSDEWTEKLSILLRRREPFQLSLEWVVYISNKYVVSGRLDPSWSWVLLRYTNRSLPARSDAVGLYSSSYRSLQDVPSLSDERGEML